MSQNHAFYSIWNMLKRVNFKKTVQCTKRPPPKHLFHCRGGKYLFSALLATKCLTSDRLHACTKRTLLMSLQGCQCLLSVSVAERLHIQQLCVQPYEYVLLFLEQHKCHSALAHCTLQSVHCSARYIVMQPIIIHIQAIVIFRTSNFPTFYSCWYKSKVGKKLRSMLV